MRHILLCLPALVLTAGTAFAQNVQSLDGFVVTGTRQLENLENLAGNTAMIDRDQIEFIGPQRPAELLNRIPGVSIQQGSGQEHLTSIRSPVLNGGPGAGSFLYLEDGVPLRAAGFANVNGLYEANVEQAGSVEVVRGPGSALYGSNALHGLINVLPRDPSKEPETTADLEWGSYGYARAMGSASGTAGGFGLRASGQEHYERGWRDRTGMNEQKGIVRGIWTGENDTLTATASGQHLFQHTGGYLTGQNAYKVRSLAKTNPEPSAYRHASSERAAMRWLHDVSDSLQLSLTPYVRNTDMDFIQHYLPSKAREGNGQTGGGVQAALHKMLNGGHSVIIGTDLETTSGWMREVQSRATQPGGYARGVHYDYDVDATVVAPYVHAEWQILEHTRLTAGTRVEHTEYDYTNHLAPGVLGRYLRTADRRDTFTTVTPKLGVAQQWGEGVATYLSLARGARAPQTSELYQMQSHQAPDQVKPETLDSIELGHRGRIGPVRVEGAVFAMRKDHVFYRDADGYNVTDGVTSHRGVELQASAPLPGDFDVGVNGSYIRHVYQFDRPVSSVVNPTDAVRKGDDVAVAPRLVGGAHLGYRFLPNSRVEIEWVHVGPYYMDASNLHRYDGHDLFNVRVEATVADGVTLHGKVMNLFNTAYADRATYANSTYQYFPGSPTTAYFGISLAF